MLINVDRRLINVDQRLINVDQRLIKVNGVWSHSLWCSLPTVSYCTLTVSSVCFFICCSDSFQSVLRQNFGPSGVHASVVQTKVATIFIKNITTLLINITALLVNITRLTSVSNIPFLAKYIPDTYPIFFSMHTIYIPYIEKIHTITDFGREKEVSQAQMKLELRLFFSTFLSLFSLTLTYPISAKGMYTYPCM